LYFLFENQGQVTNKFKVKWKKMPLFSLLNFGAKLG
jgi:hypothetical protein